MKENEERPVKRALTMDLPQRRFGFIAIEKGFIKADQLWEALVKQRAQDTGRGERRLLGMILKDMGFLSVSQVDEVLLALKDEAQSRENTPRLAGSNGAGRSTKKTEKAEE